MASLPAVPYILQFPQDHHCCAGTCKVLPLVEDELLTCACPAENVSWRTPDLALVLLPFVEVLTVVIKGSFLLLVLF